MTVLVLVWERVRMTVLVLVPPPPPPQTFNAVLECTDSQDEEDYEGHTCAKQRTRSPLSPRGTGVQNKNQSQTRTTPVPAPRSHCLPAQCRPPLREKNGIL